MCLSPPCSGPVWGKTVWQSEVKRGQQGTADVHALGAEQGEIDNWQEWELPPPPAQWLEDIATDWHGHSPQDSGSWNDTEQDVDSEQTEEEGDQNPPGFEQAVTVWKKMTENTAELQDNVYRVFDIFGISAPRAETTEKDQILYVVKLLGVEMLAMIDTGAKVNVMAARVYNTLPRPPPLEKTTHSLHAFGKLPLHTMGTFTARVETPHAATEAVFYVTEEGQELLISCRTAMQLGVIAVVRQVSVESPADAVLKEFPGLFQGLGKLRDVQIMLDIDPSVLPVALPHRRVPLPMRRPVELELKMLEEADIIEHVSGPTTWVSPVVLVPKPRCAGAIRLCVDMRLPNTAIKRVRHVTPTIDDILADLNGAKVFSKIDLRSGYHQLELKPECRHITTFSTHEGLRRYKRLSFGVSSAPEIDSFSASGTSRPN